MAWVIASGPGSESVQADRGKLRENEATVSIQHDKNPSAVDPHGVEQLRADIEATRVKVGETVEGFAAQVGIQGHLEQKRDEIPGQVAEKHDSAKVKMAEANEGLSPLTADELRDAAQDLPEVHEVPAGVPERRALVLVCLAGIGAWMLRRRRQSRGS